MRIPRILQDYEQLTDATSVKPVSAVNKSEAIVHFLQRPSESLPIGAARGPSDDDGERSQPQRIDVVALSPEAQGALTSQTQLEQMLYDAIADAFAVASVDLSEHQGIDYSPDAVSQRVVDFSIRLFGVFRERHPDLDEAETLRNFAHPLQQAIHRGTQEAIDTLERLGVPEEVLRTGFETKRNIDSGLAAFFAERRAQ